MRSTTVAALFASAVAAKEWTVTVGKGGQLKFDPETIDAQVGDKITYQFFSKNHAVVQSSFADPCHYQEHGIFSAFTPTASDSVPSATTFQITIKDTKPLWLYCPQTNGNHCQKGMVHAINAPKEGEKTFQAYKDLAAKASTSTVPPDGLPFGGLRKTTVQVGGDGLTFTPNNITEPQGTVVEFNFNPANHSVVESSFKEPCKPLDHGFFSGFIPTAIKPSGATFSYTVTDPKKAVWFYCAQTKGSHCQKGMVGSINAPTVGNTLEAFIGLAAQAPESTAPGQGPVGGILSVNGSTIASLNGAVFMPGTAVVGGGAAMPTVTTVPPPGATRDPYIVDMAGGDAPTGYNWAPSMSTEAVELLQLLQYFDNLVLDLLFKGFFRLSPGGDWAGIYPKTLVSTIGSMAAQAVVHRTTYTDCLSHYQKPFAGVCTYDLGPGSAATSSAPAFLNSLVSLLGLQISLLVDSTSLVAASDPWIVPALASAIGAKARMTAVVNLMQNHMASAAPREVLVPAPLVYSYAATRYVSSCPGDALAPGGKAWAKTWPVLRVKDKTEGTHESGGDGPTGRVTKVVFDLGGGAAPAAGGQKLYVAWLGPWGGVQYTELQSDSSAEVPRGLYGHVWAVVTSAKDKGLREIVDVTVAGPEMVWVAGNAK